LVIPQGDNYSKFAVLTTPKEFKVCANTKDIHNPLSRLHPPAPGAGHRPSIGV